MAVVWKSICAFAAAVAVATPVSAGTISPELIVNGGFEKGPAGGDIRLDPGSQAIEGWTVIRGSVDYVDDDWTSFDGKHCIDLEGEASFGGVGQTITTEPGRVYTVRFDLAGNPDGEPRIKKMRVRAAGQSTERWFDCQGRTRHNLGWLTHIWQFLAVEDRTTIQFVSVEDGPGHCGAMLENVSVEPSERPWGVRKREARPEASAPSNNARSAEGVFRLDSLIPVELTAEAGGKKDVVSVDSVVFVNDDGWIQARVSTSIVSWPKGKWRLVVELLDKEQRVLERGAVGFENSGIVMRIGVVEKRVLNVDIGPSDKASKADNFRLSVESLDLRPNGIAK